MYIKKELLSYKVALFYILILFLWKNYPDSPYLDIYKDDSKFLVLKISGELLEKEKFGEFVLYLKSLKQKGIPIILVYGGGAQITKKYENEGGKREQLDDGTNITTYDLINKGVIPVYLEIQEKLKEEFGENSINQFEKEDILCKKANKGGQIGKVEKFNKEFSKDKINIIPFVGTLNDADDSLLEIEKTLNINADDIVKKLASEFSEKISNIIFITGNGGVLDEKQKVVSFLTKQKVKDILDGNHKDIKCVGGMRKKLEVVFSLLEEGISKVTIVGLEDLKEELELFGSGTMIVDLEKATFKKLRNKSLFKLIYSKNESKGNNSGWKKRNDQEKENIFNNYVSLEVNGTVLGGFALLDTEINGKKGKLLECLFTTKIGCGLGYTLGKEIKKHDPVFAYSKNGKFFEKLLFKKVGLFKSGEGSELYIYEKY